MDILALRKNILILMILTSFADATGVLQASTAFEDTNSGLSHANKVTNDVGTENIVPLLSPNGAIIDTDFGKLITDKSLFLQDTQPLLKLKAYTIVPQFHPRESNIMKILFPRKDHSEKFKFGQTTLSPDKNQLKLMEQTTPKTLTETRTAVIASNMKTQMQTEKPKDKEIEQVKQVLMVGDPLKMEPELKNDTKMFNIVDITTATATTEAIKAETSTIQLKKVHTTEATTHKSQIIEQIVRESIESNNYETTVDPLVIDDIFETTESPAYTEKELLQTAAKMKMTTEAYVELIQTSSDIAEITEMVTDESSYQTEKLMMELQASTENILQESSPSTEPMTTTIKTTKDLTGQSNTKDYFVANKSSIDQTTTEMKGIDNSETMTILEPETNTTVNYSRASTELITTTLATLKNKVVTTTSPDVLSTEEMKTTAEPKTMASTTTTTTTATIKAVSKPAVTTPLAKSKPSFSPVFPMMDDMHPLLSRIILGPSAKKPMPKGKHLFLSPSQRNKNALVNHPLLKIPPPVFRRKKNIKRSAEEADFFVTPSPRRILSTSKRPRPSLIERFHTETSHERASRISKVLEKVMHGVSIAGHVDGYLTSRLKMAVKKIHKLFETEEER